MDTVEFKPFARYDTGSDTFQNWDSMAQNYKIQRYPNAGGNRQPASFDRQDQLLRR